MSSAGDGRRDESGRGRAGRRTVIAVIIGVVVGVFVVLLLIYGLGSANDDVEGAPTAAVPALVS